MSFHVFFQLSTGLSEAIPCPPGTLARIRKHVADVERRLGIKTETYNGEVRWCSFAMKKAVKALSDEEACKVAEDHNSFNMWLYHRFASWSKNPPKPPAERITPKQAKAFWYAIKTHIHVPAERWTADYYEARMEEIYEALRGRDNGAGISFDARPLSAKQADSVISLFSVELDHHDIRLAVPVGHDRLLRSEEYAWSSVCGAIAYDEVTEHARTCKKRGCSKDLRENHDELFEEEDEE